VKIIKVRGCPFCPYIIYDGRNYRCTGKDHDEEPPHRKLIVSCLTIDNFPEWCPLEDE
jgi:hypothetical protein